MAEPDKQYTGDGGDNYADAARKTAEAAKQIGKTAAKAGAEATANAAAATVQAGVEGGKAVAGVAAGTAAGGPWGAILSAAWALRHTLFKILIFSSLILLFLITLIVSLPSIIFGGTGASASDPSAQTDVYAVYEEMAAVVSGCVTAGYDFARAEGERIIASGDYDYTLSTEATIDYGKVSVDYDVCYILAAYSASMEQHGTSKADMQAKLNAVMALMFPVAYEVKETKVTIPPEDEDEEPTEETVYYVQCTIASFDTSVIHTAFGIDPSAPYSQFQITTGEAISNMAAALKATLYGSYSGGEVPPITDAELTAFLAKLTCSPARKELMRVALSLVGRVPYFWGGKSAPGWNDEWNTPKLVTSAGSSSSGTIRPYGLDCSGYTDWVYKTALGKSLYDGGTWSQWDNSEAITEAELLPGDLGFLDEPGAVSVNHVLLFAGYDDGGTKMWVHCSSSAGGVALNSPTYVKYYRRVTGIDLESMTVPGGAAGSFSAMEVEWLTALVYYEARGMDSYCKELTAQVAINRVNSTKFPNTLEQVIKQRGQYGYGVAGATATNIFDGSYASHKSESAWSACYAAASKAASGLSVDESGNRWPSNVLFQHSFDDPNANGTGLYRTFRTGSYWMHFNYG